MRIFRDGLLRNQFQVDPRPLPSSCGAGNTAVRNSVEFQSRDLFTDTGCAICRGNDRLLARRHSYQIVVHVWNGLPGQERRSDPAQENGRAARYRADTYPQPQRSTARFNKAGKHKDPVKQSNYDRRIRTNLREGKVPTCSHDGQTSSRRCDCSSQNTIQPLRSRAETQDQAEPEQSHSKKQAKISEPR